jgi:hypothetical protein
MPFSRDSLCISWFVEPSDTDKRRFELSGVTRCLIPYSLATARPAVLDYLGGRGVKVTVRLDVDTRGPGVIERLIPNLAEFGRRAHIEYLILGNEPENAFDMRYGSPSWGNDNDHMWSHRAAMLTLVARLRQAQASTALPRLVAPAWTCRAPRPSSAPYPGTMMWYIALQSAYARCDARAAHIYTDNARGPVDLERMQWGLQTQASMWDGPLIVDEAGVNNGTDTERTAGVLALATWLLQPTQQAVGGVGAQVELLCQFAGNAGPEWAQYTMTSDTCYRLIRNFRDGA